MRIGTSVRGYMEIPPHTWMKLVNLLKFDHVEFYSSVLFNNPEKLSDLIGIKTTAVHLPYFDDRDWDLSTIEVDNLFDPLVNILNIYKHKLQVRWLIVHPPEDPKPNWDLFIKRLKQVGGNTRICLENIKTMDIKQFAKLYRKAKFELKDQLGFCFDAVHSFLANEEFLKIPEDLLLDLQYIHLNDTESKEFDEHLPLGDGILPLNEFFDFLKQIEFDGIINLEVKPKNALNALSVVDSYLRVLRRFQFRKYLQTKIRLIFLKPILKRRLKQLSKV